MSAEHFASPSAVTHALPPAWPQYSQSALDSVVAAVARGDVYAFSDHQALVDLEEWARSYFGVRYALAIASGTAALHSAYHGIGIGTGDEVLVPTYTFHATATPLTAMGAVPVLYDCEVDSACPNVDDLKRRITQRTKAIVVSHMFGQMGDMARIRDVGLEFGLPIVEDAAQAHGAHDGVVGKAGTIGQVGCFSLGGQKMVSGGMGGLLITNDSHIYERALNFGHAHERAQARIARNSPEFIKADVGYGMNFRMHPLAAVLALDHARTLDSRIAIRTRTLLRLSELLGEFEFLNVPMRRPGASRGGWYGYKVLYNSERLGGRSIGSFVLALQKQGLKVAVPTTKPLHQTTLGGAQREASLSEFPNATGLYARTISFPDKHFHFECDELLEQYADGVRRVAQDTRRMNAA